MGVFSVVGCVSNKPGERRSSLLPSTSSCKYHSLFLQSRAKSISITSEFSIDFSVFSGLQENLLRYCWPTHSYSFGVILKLND